MKEYCIIPFIKGIKAFFNFYHQIPLAMRLFIFMLFFVSGMVYSANGYSQLVSIDTKAPIRSILDEIEKQTSVSFFINNKDIDLERKVSVSASNSKIEKILATLFSGTNVKFQIIGDQVILSSNKKALDPLPNEIQQKTITITGLVTDGDGNPLIGVTIKQADTSNGAITDIDGRYSIKVPAGSKLIYNYVGFNTEEKVIKQGMTTVNVRMLELSESLEEVVVIGYGQQKKESVVASMNSITSKELSMPTRSLTNSLAGQISGIIAVQRSGEPGNDDSDFWIRGVSSFAGGTTPLVLVDGVPRAMSDIGADEIETLTVLKDASATAIYGAEGANGVILITSKRGAAEKPRLNIRADFSMSTPTRLPDMIGSYDWAKLYNEAAWNDKGNPQNFVDPYSSEVLNHYLIGDDPDLYPNADFLSLLNNRTYNQRVTLNLRGGAERVRYFVSGSFYNESGIFGSQALEKYSANIGLSRYNIRSNIDIDVTKTTKLSVDVSGQYKNTQNPGKTSDVIFTQLLKYAPNEFPLVFSDGTVSEHPMYNGYGDEGTCNPYNLLYNYGYQKRWDAFLQSGITLEQKMDFITKGLTLKLKGSFDADFWNITKRNYDPTSYKMVLKNGEKVYEQLHSGTDKLSDFTATTAAGRKKIYLEASLNYARKFNELHDLSAMLLYMQKDTQTTGVPLPYKKQSVVARVAYGYDRRYMLESSFGLTGSENFASGHRWGIFPSIGLAWYISNEKFMLPLEDVISKLKLRASWGLTGNDAVPGGRFPYRATYKTDDSGYNFGFKPGTGGGISNSSGSGVTEIRFEAPFLSWEKEIKKNIGIDLGLFRGQVDLNIDFFKNNRKDILMKRKAISGVVGFRENPYMNFGEVENKGFDGNVVIKQNIDKVMLTFRGNITYAHNTVLEFDEVEPLYSYQRYTGQTMEKPLLYIADGLYTPDDFNTVTNSDGTVTYTLIDGLPKTSTEVRPGDIKYRDLNGDNMIDGYDRTYDHNFRSQSPEWVYGFGMNVSYKGIYASCFFQGSANCSVKLNASAASFVPFQAVIANAVRREAVDSRWNPNDPYNQNVLYPRLHTSNYSHNNEASTWWYRKGDFLRLKDVELGYQFNKKTLQKIKVQNARIYVQGSNLFVWDDIKMWDPELGNANSGAKYPLNRIWTLGLEIGF